MTFGTIIEDRALLSRAFDAYGKHLERIGVLYTQPSNESFVIEVDGQRFVQLLNVNGNLAVYGVQHDNTLKFYPDDYLEEMEENISNNEREKLEDNNLANTFQFLQPND